LDGPASFEEFPSGSFIPPDRIILFLWLFGELLIFGPWLFPVSGLLSSAWPHPFPALRDGGRSFYIAILSLKNYGHVQFRPFAFQVQRSANLLRTRRSSPILSWQAFAIWRCHCGQACF